MSGGMLKPLLFVVALGAGLGFLWPTGHHASVARAADPSQPTLIERSPQGHFYVDAEINGELVHCIVDTGASMVALPVDDARRLGIPFSEGEFEPVGKGAGGVVMGKDIVLDSISVDGKKVEHVPGAILQGNEICLLGQTYLNRLSSVEMSGGVMRLQ
jgi:aspartyl protease family protein